MTTDTDTNRHLNVGSPSTPSKPLCWASSLCYVSLQLTSACNGKCLMIDVCWHDKFKYNWKWHKRYRLHLQELSHGKPALIRMQNSYHLLLLINWPLLFSADPNDESPANVDAAVEWRNEYPSFRKRVLRCVRKSQQEMEDSWSFYGNAPWTSMRSSIVVTFFVGLYFSLRRRRSPPPLLTPHESRIDISLLPSLIQHWRRP